MAYLVRVRVGVRVRVRARLVTGQGAGQSWARRRSGCSSGAYRSLRRRASRLSLSLRGWVQLASSAPAHALSSSTKPRRSTTAACATCTSRHEDAEAGFTCLGSGLGLGLVHLLRVRARARARVRLGVRVRDGVPAKPDPKQAAPRQTAAV